MDEMSGRFHLLVFAKAPRPGMAKTRLIPLLGAEGAALLQAGLTRWTIETGLASGIGPVELWCAPDRGDPFFAALQRRYGVSLHDQRDGDLGQRMLHAAQDCIARSGMPIIVGTDCPGIGRMTLCQARDALRMGHDAVVIPAADGGYVLIGLARAAPELFSGLDWGGPEVMAQTRQRLMDLRYRFRLFDPLPDLDRPEDCIRFQRQQPELWDSLSIEAHAL